MNFSRLPLYIFLALALLIVGTGFFDSPDPSQQVPRNRQEVLFWHFWGGADRDVVEDVVKRFNRSQEKYFVRAIAMPGNNLDVKLFLAITGGDPPDLVNQDDPIVADWAERGALTPLDELASGQEIARLRNWLFPSARRLGEYEGRLYALCNGLDIRALYYNKSLLDQHGLQPPATIQQLDELAEKLAQFDKNGQPTRLGYLPDSRRLWAWGVVFGGNFFDEPAGRVNLNSEPIAGALQWMSNYSLRYGAKQVAAFRQGDQSLPGKSFPLLSGRYAMVMDGQWRTRDIAASQERQRREGLPITQYGVCPLPAPPAGRRQAGWVNGNFFLVPKGAKNQSGAWAFMKFWSGLDGGEAEAARTCASGGWIPVSQKVVDEPLFRKFLKRQPLFAEFVKLAASENQFPIPVIPAASFFDREIKRVGAQAMAKPDEIPPRKLLEIANERIQQRLDRRRLKAISASNNPSQP